MKKIISTVFAICAIALCFQAAQAATVQKVKPKAPYVSEEMKPIIEKYRGGNYVSAMQDLEEILSVNSTDALAKYYLALCYTQLGYKSEATNAYQDVIKLNSNLPLTYYSKRALDCLENPEANGCLPKINGLDDESNQNKEGLTDIEKFIESGKKIHPSAMDKILNGRYERQLQEEEYIKRQQEKEQNLKSQAPTNEEIASALNTLSKIGFNPFQVASQNQMLGQYGINPMMLGNNGSEVAQMMLYSQLNNQIGSQFGRYQNNFMNNYGI